MDKKIIVSNLIWKFLERMGSQLVSFVISIILARILLPEEYGIISIVLSFIAIADIFLFQGLATSLIQKKDSDNTDFSTIFFINLILGIVLYFILFMIAPIISQYYEIEILNPVIRILGISVIFSSISSIQSAYIAKNMLFKKYFTSTLISTVLSGSISVYLALNGYGVWSLVFQSLSSSCFVIISLFFAIRWRPQMVFNFSSAVTHFKYGWKLLLAAVLDSIYTQSRKLIIGKKYSIVDLAYYNRGNQFPELIMTNVSSAISSVFFPVVSNIQDDLPHVKSTVRYAIVCSTFILFPILSGLAAVGIPIITVLLTEKWLFAYPFMLIGCISFSTWPIQIYNQNAIKAIGKSRTYLMIEIIRKIIGVILLIIAIPQGVMIIALSMLVSEFASTLIVGIYANLELKYDFREQFIDIFPQLIISIAMFFLVYLFNKSGLNSFLLVGIQVLTGSIFYIVSTLIFKLKGFKILKALFLNFFSKKE